MIHFDKLTAKNFMSIGNVPIGYEFEIGQTYLVKGVNGSGKSSLLLDGLTFALYGKAFRNINLAGLANSINRKDCVVTLDFHIGNVKYRIERGLYPTFFNFYVNGKLREKEASKHDYQKHLEKQILRLDERTYRQIVILGSKAYVPFMQLGAGARRVVVEELLELGIFSVMNNVTKTKMAALMTDAKINESNIKIIQNSISETTGIIEQLRSTGDEYTLQKQEQIDKMRASVDALEDEIIKTEQKIDELLENSDLDMEIDGLRTFMMKIIEQASRAKAELSKIDKEIKFFETNDICSTCHQEIDEEFKGNICDGNHKKADQYRKALLVAETEKTKADANIATKTAALELVRGFRHDVKISRTDIEGKNKMIKSLILDIENHSKKEGSNISVYEHKLAEANTQLQLARDLDSDIMTKGRRLAYIHEMLKDGGIKTKIIETYLPLINKLVSRYMEIMESDIQFQFDDKFSEIIKSRHRDNFEYASFSEGEKLRIDLALLFTWREISRLRNSASTNLVIFDEIGDSSLDENGFECFMKILAEEKAKQCVILISHSPEKIAGKCDRVYSYKKEKNFTTLESLTINEEVGASLT